MQDRRDRFKIKSLMNSRNVPNASGCDLANGRVRMLSELQASILCPPPIRIMQSYGAKRRANEFRLIGSEGGVSFLPSDRLRLLIDQSPTGIVVSYAPAGNERYNVEVIGAAQLYRAASVLTAGLENYFARRYRTF